MTWTASELVADVLADIAPDVDPADVDADLHDGLGLDSMDIVNLVAAVHERTGIAIPEADYPRMSTLRALATYLDAHRAPD